MHSIQIIKNSIQSNGYSYSNYIYTFNIAQSNYESDSIQLLPYQIETNSAFEHYLNEQNDVLAKFKNVLALEENYFTIMNVCVTSLALRDYEELEQWVNRAIIHSQGQIHHIILLAEMHLIIHDYDNALKQLIQLFFHEEQQTVVQALLKEVFKSKLYSPEHLGNFAQDSSIIEQLTKMNKQCFIQHHSQSILQTHMSQNLHSFKQQQQLQELFSQSSFHDEINKTISYQTQQTDQLSFIQFTQDEENNSNQQQLLDYCFIDIILDNPNLFSFQFRIPYMIGSYNIKNINKLQSKIAQGGFGEVYVAKHLITNEIHALKIIKQQEDYNVNQILQETIIQDKIQKLNPQLFLNLKPLVYIKKQSKFVDIYIPLELGEFSLYEYITEHKINDQEYNQFYNLFIDFIVTLHSNKYAHRDIKPQNILYIKEVGWKLADFGESINYDNVEDIYKIRGTFAFLPFELRQQSKNKEQAKQNLLYNDLYSVVCTLIMIKNPSFDSKELTNYMDNNQLDQQLQQLLLNLDNLEHLKKMKITQQQQIQSQIIIKKQMQDQECQWDCYEKLKFYTDQYKPLDNDFIQQLDLLLASYKHYYKQDELIYLSLFISILFPFQIEKFQNLIIFDFQRHLLARFNFLYDRSQSLYYSTVIDYFLNIKLYDLAIRICDYLLIIEYELYIHLLKVNALICLNKLKLAKEELEKVHRCFLSTQSYSLKEQFLFFNLYFVLHKEIPKIKMDKIFKDDLINGLRRVKSNYHQIDLEVAAPINLRMVNEKQHLKIRLDVIFDFVQLDYSVDSKKFLEIVGLFGNDFIEDGQLQNCQLLIQLLKENLIFWSNHYKPKIHIIAIGFNFLFAHYGYYFHNILRNVGSVESILAHYEHLLDTQLILFELFNQPPYIYVDFNRCLLEIQNLQLFDQIYFNLKSMIFWYIIEINFKQSSIQQDINNRFKQCLSSLLDQMKNILNQEYINSNQLNNLRQQLIFMIIKLSRQILINLQVVKKLFKLLVFLNYKDKIVFIFKYNEALKITKQYKMSIVLVKQQMDHLIKHQILQLLEKFIYKDLIKIFISPQKVLTILKGYGLSKKKCLLASLEYNLNDDVRHFLYCHQEFSKTKISTKIRCQIDKINLHYQYINA